MPAKGSQSHPTDKNNGLDASGEFRGSGEKGVVNGNRSTDGNRGVWSDDHKTQKKSEPTVIEGPEGDTEIHGTEGDDSIYAGDGDDDLYGGAGADSFYFGGSDDSNTIHDYSADDQIVLVDTNFLMQAGINVVGDDLVFTSTQSDLQIIIKDYADNEPIINFSNGDLTWSLSLIVGDLDDNLINGDNQDNLIISRAGQDIIYGHGGNDVIRSNQDTDIVYGGDGHDSITSGQDNDWLYGERGNDYLHGRAGDDHVNGGKGDDVLVGGSGFDFFQFDDKWGNDVIEDFEDGFDLMDLSSQGLNFEALTITQSGSDTIITYNGDSITLTGMDSSQISGDDFIF